MKKEIHKLVLQTLIDYPKTRSDDYLLILKVLDYFVEPQMTLEAVMEQHALLGIPSIETITRCRRKIQALRPDLVDEEARKRRKKEEAEFKEYAKERELA